MELISKSKKRYKYHRKLKKLDIEYNARENVIYMPIGTEESDLPEAVKHLRACYGYSVTFKIS
jgi:hypothetical protein